MAHLYLDHNVAHSVGVLLGDGGHDVLASRAINAERLPDDVLLLTSVRLSRVFVTHNRADFRMLHDAWVTWPAAFGMALPSHPGILVLDSAPPETLASVIATFLDEVPSSALPNAAYWWHRRDSWDRTVDGGPWEPYGSFPDSDQE